MRCEADLVFNVEHFMCDFKYNVPSCQSQMAPRPGRNSLANNVDPDVQSIDPDVQTTDQGGPPTTGVYRK